MNAHAELAISRAKQDWESAADTLPHLLCLLDADSRVVRVNRAVESWGLGLVTNVTRRSVHDLLHPSGCSVECKLKEMLSHAWHSARDGMPAEFELRDPQLERAVSVALRPINADSSSCPPGAMRVVMLVTDITPLRAARAALERLNESLEARVYARTRELEGANLDLQQEIGRRESAEEALRLSRNELALLSQQLIKAQENERARIAQELHDSVGQSLSAIKYSLEGGAELHRKGRHADCQPLLLRTIDRVRATIHEIRSIAMGLRPSVLDDLGVASALVWLCREFGETYAGIEIDTCISACDQDIPERLVTTIFRCAQELLNNVAKHSRARHVSLALVKDTNTIALMVYDDGIGLPTPDSSGSFGTGHGIRNLRERAQMTGGRLSLSADGDTGTRAKVEWALAHQPSST